MIKFIAFFYVSAFLCKTTLQNCVKNIHFIMYANSVYYYVPKSVAHYKR